MLKLTLPFPPSINHYWRRVGNRTIISKAGREFRERVVARLKRKNLDPIDGELAVEIQISPPDRRRRDLDNCLKALLDAMQHGGVYHDDFQIACLMIERLPPVKNGNAIVTIRELKLNVEPTSEQTIKSAVRICLKCQKTFDSIGPANRICPICTRINRELGSIPECVLAKERGVKRLNGEVLE